MSGVSRGKLDLARLAHTGSRETITDKVRNVSVDAASFLIAAIKPIRAQILPSMIPWVLVAAILSRIALTLA